jgi:6-pyruvoyltetrahydropterin/6-carboxytetrahydropterin synthase
MYTVTVTRSFVAQHYLTVPDPGPEGEVHSHHFTVEVELSGAALNEYGYLVDIDEVKAATDAVVARYRDETLNAMPAFEGLNPSVEHFARVFCEGVLDRADLDGPERIAVRLWEDETARAGHERPVPGADAGG